MLLICAGIHPNPGPVSQDHRVISICHANIRSLKHVDKLGIYDKLMHIKCNLVKDFKIVTLSETWLTSDDSSNRFMIPGFQKPFRRDRDANTGTVGYGGILAWIHDSIACKRRLDLELPTIEAMWLEVRSKNKKFFLCVVYRAPLVKELWETFQQTLTWIRSWKVPKL